MGNYKSFKILHLVTGDLNSDGASRGAFWLHLGLKECGIDSKILVRSPNKISVNSVININSTKKQKLWNYFLYTLDKLIIKLLYKKRKRIIFNTGLFGLDFTKTKDYREADIIHLHWVNDAFLKIKTLKKVNKPIVWTMRDMWPMTGGCHVAEAIQCDHYKSGCGNCIQLGSNKKNDLSRYILNRKKKYFPKSMKIIGISHWLSEKAKESELFKNFDVRTIHNNIEMKEFFPIQKETAKDILNIQTKKKIILTGATHLKVIWKGFHKYLEAISKLDRGKYFLCFMGDLDSSLINKLGFEYKSFGLLKDNISLRLAYSAANVFVAPSLMDTFGKTLAEAMACKTPVVCFDATGPKDIVTHKKDGYKAKPFESEDLKNGIEWVIQAPNYEELCKNAREKVAKNFDSKIIAKKYIKLYQEILNE